MNLILFFITIDTSKSNAINNKNYNRKVTYTHSRIIIIKCEFINKYKRKWRKEKKLLWINFGEIKMVFPCQVMYFSLFITLESYATCIKKLLFINCIFCLLCSRIN